MSKTPTTNHRVRQNGTTSGVLQKIDTMTGSDGKPYPVAILKRPDGSRRAVHLESAGEIAAISKAEPNVGDTLTFSSDLLHVDRADAYGLAGMKPQPAADWTRWALAAFHRDPESPRLLRPEPVAPAPAVAAPRVRRPIRLPDGRFATTDEPMPSAARGMVVPDRDNVGLEIRR